MAFVTSKMWKQRVGRLDDVAKFNGAPVAVARMWGRQFAKRFVGEWLRGDTKAIPNGREFRLSTESVLRWERHPNPASLPLALDGGDALKETIVIERRPSRTELTFEIDLPVGSMLLYQPPLTPEEVAAGCVRPAEIVGSFAVYGPLGEKIGHLLRPHATDAGGRFEWLDMDAMELPDRPGTWRVRILPRSPAWLNEAVWPVTIDPTFGYTSIGGTDGSNSPDYLTVNGPMSGALAPGSDGTITEIKIYGSGSSLPTKACVYADSSGAPGARVDYSTQVTVGSANWYSFTPVVGAAITPGTLYHIGQVHSSGALGQKHDSLAGVGYRWKTFTYADPPNPFGSPTGSYLNYVDSSYVVYTAPSAGQPFLKRFGGVPFAALNKGVW